MSSVKILVLTYLVYTGEYTRNPRGINFIGFMRCRYNISRFCSAVGCYALRQPGRVESPAA
jgi:hypothetical protein